jgi:hypothetical protein
MSELKEEIRKNTIPIVMMIITISLLLTWTIYANTMIKRNEQNQTYEENLTSKCEEFCKAKGLIYSGIDIAGTGYTMHKQTGRCLCINKNEMNK